jgi:O-6-methylguanine DNA methyltransferase
MKKNIPKKGPHKKFAAPLSAASELANLVYKAISTIPKGKVLTYKELAAKSGKPKAVRRVASIVGQNKAPITIPCHRVIRSDGFVGEYTYKGKRNRAKKISLLKSEGIRLNGLKVLR